MHELGNERRKEVCLVLVARRQTVYDLVGDLRVAPTRLDNFDSIKAQL